MMSALVWVVLGALILLAILAVLAGVLFSTAMSMSRQSMGMGGGILGRLGRLVRASLNAGSRPALRQVTLETLQPGDAIEFWDGQHALVENVLDCTEELHGRLTRWQWVLLDTGAVLEIGREGRRIFDRSVVCYQGSPEFEELVADPERGGVLKTFEQRVREGRSATEPVVYERDGTRWVVRSTGTFAATVRGRPLEREVWADISSDPGQNVYFEMDARVEMDAFAGNAVGGDEPERGRAADTRELLGIWTTHILLLYGRRLQETDITGLFGA